MLSRLTLFATRRAPNSDVRNSESKKNGLVGLALETDRLAEIVVSPRLNQPTTDGHELVQIDQPRAVGVGRRGHM